MTATWSNNALRQRVKSMQRYSLLDNRQPLCVQPITNTSELNCLEIKKDEGDETGGGAFQGKKKNTSGKQENRWRRERNHYKKYWSPHLYLCWALDQLFSPTLMRPAGHAQQLHSLFQCLSFFLHSCHSALSFLKAISSSSPSGPFPAPSLFPPHSFLVITDKWGLKYCWLKRATGAYASNFPSPSPPLSFCPCAYFVSAPC